MPNDAIARDGDSDPNPPTVKPAWWTKRRIIALLVGLPFLLLFGCYLVLLARYHSQSPQINRNYTKEFNEPILKIPAEQRAWTHYRRALMLLEKLPEETPVDAKFGEEPPRFEPRDPDWNAKLAYLRRNQEGIAAVRAAAKIRPLGTLLSSRLDPEDRGWAERHGGMFVDEMDGAELSENPPMMAIYHPCEGQLMHLVKLLQADAWRCVEIRDGALLVETIASILSIGRQLDDSPHLLPQLIAGIADNIASELTSRIACDHADVLTNDEWRRLAADFDQHVATRKLGICFDGERATIEDIAQRVFADDGSGDGAFLPEAAAKLAQNDSIEVMPRRTRGWTSWATSPIASALIAGRKETLEKYLAVVDIIERESQLPLWRRNSTAYDAAFGDLSQSPIRNQLILSIIPSLDTVAAPIERSFQSLEAARAVCALARYECAHGTWPKVLEQLQPAFLTGVPIDRCDGQPLRYRLRNGQPILYSIGADQNDDGGYRSNEPGVGGSMKNRMNDLNSDLDIDLVFFPPRRFGYPKPPEPDDDAEAWSEGESEESPQGTDKFDTTEESAVR